jgi:hypothetical protein
MPEHDKKERLLTGDTLDTEVQLNSVRADLVSYVRVKKGLPANPVALDVTVLSSLQDAPVIDDSEKHKPEEKPVDHSRYGHTDSISALGILQTRIGRKKAA